MVADAFDCDKWEEVKSSNIEAVGVKGDWLVVRFRKGGQVYRYRGFADLFDELVSSLSIGKFFAREVLSQTKGERLLRDEWPDEI
jgi:hypothetical protein